MYIDFHTHLYAYADTEKLEKTLSQQNDLISVSAAVDEPSFFKTKQIADSIAKCTGRAYTGPAAVPAAGCGVPRIIPTFGIHPAEAARYAGRLSTIEPLLAESPLIGEIGLDFFWVQDVPAHIQERVFLYQLDHCEKTGKYCVIHTKSAERRIAAILKDFPHCKPVIHWYDGDESVFRDYLSRGWPVTFGCETRYSPHIRQLLGLVPEPLLLAETDNPTGEPWLGGTDSSPALIRRVYSDIASGLGRSVEAVTEIINANSLRILREAGIPTG
jgi:TatD DNase family protein